MVRAVRARARVEARAEEAKVGGVAAAARLAARGSPESVAGWQAAAPRAEGLSEGSGVEAAEAAAEGL